MTVKLKKGKRRLNKYIIYRFRPAAVKEIIHVVLREALSEKQYSGDEAKNWTKEISDSLQTKLKGVYPKIVVTINRDFFLLSDLQLDRYKYVVQVVIGEQRGEGVR